jgi:hypothetical protein
MTPGKMRVKNQTLPPPYGALPCESWGIFREEMRRWISNNAKMPVNQIHLVLAGCMTGVAKRVTEWIVYGPNFQSITELLTAYDGVFQPAPDPEEWQGFLACQQGGSESLERYHQKVKGRFEDLYDDYKDLPADIKQAQQGRYAQQFLRGMRDTSLAEPLRRLNPDTYEGLLVAAQAWEKNKQQPLLVAKGKARGEIILPRSSPRKEDLPGASKMNPQGEAVSHRPVPGIPRTGRESRPSPEWELHPMGPTWGVIPKQRRENNTLRRDEQGGETAGPADSSTTRTHQGPPPCKQEGCGVAADSSTPEAFQMTHLTPNETPSVLDRAPYNSGYEDLGMEMTTDGEALKVNWEQHVPTSIEALFLEVLREENMEPEEPEVPSIPAYRPWCPIQLDGITGLALVDSGSDLGIVISDVWAHHYWGPSYLDRLNSVSTSWNIQGALQNSNLSLCGQTQLPMYLQIGEGTIPFLVHPIVAAGLGTDVVIGRGFLEEFQIDQQHTNQTLVVGGQEISLVEGPAFHAIFAMRGNMTGRRSTHGTSHPSREVEITERVVIPAQSAGYVTLRLRGPNRRFPATNGVLNLHPQFVRMYGSQPAEATCLSVNPEGRTTTAIVNSQGMAITLDPKELLGNLTPVWVVPPDEKVLASLYKTQKGNMRVPHYSEPSPFRSDQKKLEWLEQEFRLKEAPWLQRDQKGREQAKALLLRYYDVFSKDDEYGCTNLIQHEIHTEGHPPLQRKGKPVDPSMYDNLKEQMGVWEKQKVVEPSTSPWSFGLLPVKKKNGKVRWVIDFRGLNGITLKDSYPLPNIEDNLSRLAHSRVFSALDGTGAYHVIAIRKKDRAKTAFHTPFGKFQFRRMPFGLCNAPATYSRLVQKVMEGISPEVALTYLDDTCIHTNTMELHLATLEEVFKAYQKAGLMLQPSKCQLFQDQVEYLGHLVAEEGIRPIPAYVQLVAKWEYPRTLKEWRTFLGKVAYYRKFIPGFSHISSPLYALLQEGGGPTPQDIPTGILEQEAFRQLKQDLQGAPALAYPDFTSDQPFRLATDFNQGKTAMGGILSQLQKGVDRVIYYGAKKLGKAELNYPQEKGDILAVVHFVRLWRYYFEHRPFQLKVDPASWKWFSELEEPRGMLQRWGETLANYQFKVVDGSFRGLDLAPGPKKGTSFLPNLRTVAAMESNLQAGDLRSLGASKTMRWHQRQDAHLQRVISWVEEGTCPTPEEARNESTSVKQYLAWYETLSLNEEGVLGQGSPDANHPGIRRTCIPERLQAEIVRKGHEVTGLHMTLEQTQARLEKYVYFPEMLPRTTLVVAKCQGCYRNKITQNWGSGATFQHLLVEVVGPIPNPRGEARFLLVLTDHDTRWMEAYCLLDDKITTLAKVIEERIVETYGPPEVLGLLPDSQLSGRRLKELGDRLQIPYQETGNEGENPCRLEKASPAWRALTPMVLDEESTLEECVPSWLKALRIRRHPITGITPFLAHTGHEGVVPLQLLYGRLPPRGHQGRKVALTIRKLQKTEGAHFESRPRHYLPGKPPWTPETQVSLISPSGHPTGLLHSWTGPWEITEGISHGLYRIRSIGEWAGKEPPEGVVGANRLRAWDGTSPRHPLSGKERFFTEDQHLEQSTPNLNHWGVFQGGRAPLQVTRQPLEEGTPQEEPKVDPKGGELRIEVRNILQEVKVPILENPQRPPAPHPGISAPWNGHSPSSRPRREETPKRVSLNDTMESEEEPQVREPNSPTWEEDQYDSPSSEIWHSPATSMHQESPRTPKKGTPHRAPPRDEGTHRHFWDHRRLLEGSGETPPKNPPRVTSTRVPSITGSPEVIKVLKTKRQEDVSRLNPHKTQ